MSMSIVSVAVEILQFIISDNYDCIECYNEDAQVYDQLLFQAMIDNDKMSTQILTALQSENDALVETTLYKAIIESKHNRDILLVEYVDDIDIFSIETCNFLQACATRFNAQR